MFTDFFHDVWLEYKISVLIRENPWINSRLPKNDPLVTGYGRSKILSHLQMYKNNFVLLDHCQPWRKYKIQLLTQ